MSLVPHEHEQIAQIAAWQEELQALHTRISPHFRRPRHALRRFFFAQTKTPHPEHRLPMGIVDDRGNFRVVSTILSWCRPQEGVPGVVRLLHNRCVLCATNAMPAQPDPADLRSGEGSTRFLPAKRTLQDFRDSAEPERHPDPPKTARSRR